MDRDCNGANPVNAHEVVAHGGMSPVVEVVYVGEFHDSMVLGLSVLGSLNTVHDSAVMASVSKSNSYKLNVGINSDCIYLDSYSSVIFTVQLSVLMTLI